MSENLGNNKNSQNSRIIYGQQAVGKSVQNVQNSVNSQRMLPNNIEAEKSVLSACLLSKTAVEEVVTKLEAKDFFRLSHQTIFDCILDLYKRHLDVDHLTLLENAKGRGLLESIGGEDYIIELASNDYSLTNWRSHTDIIKRQSVLRDLILASVKIQAMAYEAPDDLSLVVGDAEKLLFEVTERKLKSKFKRLDSLMSDAYQEIQELSMNKSKLVGVPTGFKDLDSVFNGLRGGDLIVLAARPGVGKTSFALNLAVNCAKLGVKVAFMSLEMGANQITQRILSTESSVNLSKIRSGKLNSKDWTDIASSAERIGDLDLFIDDTPGLSIFDLRAKARRELRDVKPNGGIIIVDYLQLMQPPNVRRDGNRVVEIAEISRGLKILAKELNIPVVALSQLNRSVENRGKRGTKGKPQLSDLRESGSIEQDADIVMFIDRSMNEQEAEDDSRPDWNTAEIDIAKHRNGPTKIVTLRFEPRFTKFEDLAHNFSDSDVQGYINGKNNNDYYNKYSYSTNQYANPKQPSTNAYLNPNL